MDPIRNVLSLPCDPQAAFTLFTTGMGSWWDPRYTPDEATWTGIDVAPHVGGAVVLRHGAAAYPFGEVLACEPGVRYAQSFWLAMDRAHPSRLDVTFTARAVGCDVEVTHGGWTDANASARVKFGDWPHLLDRYATAAGG